MLALENVITPKLGSCDLGQESNFLWLMLDENREDSLTVSNNTVQLSRTATQLNYFLPNFEGELIRITIDSNGTNKFPLGNHQVSGIIKFA